MYDIMLLDIYELGLIIEYLTPACPAKCIIISILFLYQFIFFEKFFLLFKSIFKNLNLENCFKIFNRSYLIF